MFTDPNGMLEMSTIDSMMEYEGTWYNTGSGFTNNSAMKSIDYDGNFINWGEDYTNGLLANIGITNGGGDVAGTATLPLTWVGDPSNITWAWQILANQQAFVEKMNSRQALEEERQLFLMMNAGRLNDGPIRYVGGAGDVFGIFEVGGMILSASDNQNMRYASIPFLVMTRNGDDALKLLAAEKGMLSGGSQKMLAPYYPLDGGAMGKWSNITLEVGSKIDRFGSNYGKYFSNVGTPLEMRALPPGNTGAYTTFEVLKPFTVQTSKIAPAFGQIGTGVQYYSPFLNAKELIMGGFIKPIP